MKKQTENDLGKVIDELKAEVSTLRKRQTSMAQQIAAVKKLTGHEDFNDRLKSISSRMLALTIKDAVMTEVANRHPGTAARLYKFRDMPDEFWIERDKWTIDEWAEAIRFDYLQRAA